MQKPAEATADSKTEMQDLDIENHQLFALEKNSYRLLDTLSKKYDVGNTHGIVTCYRNKYGKFVNGSAVEGTLGMF